MKKTNFVFAALIACSCESTDSQKYSAYYDSSTCMLYIVNSDEYTTRMIWNSNVSFLSIDVCLLPENREIHLESNWK
jgi:hypothetical protein